MLNAHGMLYTGHKHAMANKVNQNDGNKIKSWPFLNYDRKKFLLIFRIVFEFEFNT